jgi:hypothetical protein
MSFVESLHNTSSSAVRRTMFRTIVAALSVVACSLAGAQDLTLADVKAKNAVQLSADDLKQLMPGAKVVSRTNAGSTRLWQNGADGTFIAGSDGRGVSGGRTMPGTGTGTWRVADNGRLCVAIQWTRINEDWCRYIFKSGDKYYGFGKLEDTAPASEFEFSK